MQIFFSFNCFLKNETWVTLEKIDSSQAEVKHNLRAQILSKPSSSPVSNTFKPSLNSPNLLKHRSNTPLVAHDEIEPKKSIAACNGNKMRNHGTNQTCELHSISTFWSFVSHSFPSSVAASSKHNFNKTITPLQFT